MANYTKTLVSPSLLLRIGAWRAPIFMVDRIVDFTPGERGSITVIKHVTFNEPYIPGHFPDNPVMPGVMIAEIFGQASEYFSLLCDYCQRHEKDTGTALKRFDDIARSLVQPEGVERIVEERERVGGFLASQDLKFRHVVTPGDTVEVCSRLVMADVNGFHHYDVEARVGRHVASSGRIVNFRIDRELAKSKGTPTPIH
ncbi:3-hydroxyacyl-ACP dehydratase FabZ family protein [Entomohabitans teleogrylli]|uniref:3-hydroxyacyl-ACP dehydratase FabZ family protein n=1 Tax=Entomohabitans teleogrylli TaxID=1384589 RepID=UPI0008FC3688|nr:3-hydroxyacyl-ACP dehydratase FabZ family protein [Entomohabitans teleogrylli]